MEMLDFNAIQRPTWPLKLKDDAKTVVHLSPVTVDLVDRLLALAPSLRSVAASGSGKSIRAVFDLVAEIMSVNEDCITFTAEELINKYRMTLLDVFKFVAGYMEFIKEIQDAKN